MTQRNLQTGTMREIRPPYKMGRPSKPVVPQGETVMVRVPMDAPTDAIFQIEHPSGTGVINVQLPPGTKPGALMMVPLPPAQDDRSGGRGSSRPSGRSGNSKGDGGGRSSNVSKGDGGRSSNVSKGDGKG